MCPSFRVTKDEKDSTRGRANSLRLALSGQLGKDALSSEKMNDTMKLCVSCKACKRECPTGVDMSRMKIEISSLRAKKSGFVIDMSIRLPTYISDWTALGMSTKLIFSTVSTCNRFGQRCCMRCMKAGRPGS